MKTRYNQAHDGRRLIQVEVAVQGPEANEPKILVTYEMFIPSDWTSPTITTQGLVHLSTIRMDTCEPYSLAPDQAREVMGVAMQAVADFDPDW